jgi:hypothetical protein
MDKLASMIYREQRVMGLAEPGAVKPGSHHLFNVGFRRGGDARNDEVTFMEAANRDGLLGIAEAVHAANLVFRSLRGVADVLYVDYAGMA